MAQKRLVLSDASPLIALAATGAFGLLRELFRAVSVTAEVRGEVLAGGARPGAIELRRGMAARWIRVHRIVTGAPAFPKRLFEHGFHFSPELARSLLKDVGEG